MEKILDLQNQSSLARLLATENITVTHQKSLSTAYFDVKNRILGLPIWKDQGKVVYDMLVGHEVSHALFTPVDGFEKFLEKEDRKYFDILNIIEDIRIERLIKLKYAGMPRIFNGAYKTLVESDFFNIADKDISELCFLDRLNLRGKIGTIVDIPLNEKEEELYNECYAAKTFEDVVELYHKIKKFAQEEAKAEKEEESPEEESPEEEESKGDEESEDTSNSSSGEDASDEDTSDEADDGEESHSVPSDVSDEEKEKAIDELIAALNDEPSENDTLGKDKAGDKSDSRGEDIILEPKTTKALEENLVDAEASEEGQYHTRVDIALWPTKKTINKHIIDYKEVMATRGPVEEFFPDDYYLPEERAEYVSKLRLSAIEFKKTTNKKVGVLAREFERRKASFQYSRAQESRRGSLDVNKLHRYEYDDQIFQSVMQLADAKSHGMIFFIDYSGSMAYVLKDVLEHTLNLVHFCKKVGIPFKVYSFTSNWSLDERDVSQSGMELDMEHLVLGELFSSEMSTKEYNEAFEMVSFQLLNSMDGRFSQQGTSPFEHLGGTPLDHALIAAHQIVDEFRKKNPVQKLNVIVLTDGESQSVRRKSAHSYNTAINVAGKQRKISRQTSTKQYLQLLKEVKGVNTIGFFLPENKRAGKSHLRSMAFDVKATDKTDAWQKKYNKENHFHAAKCFGYDSYFLLADAIKIEDEEFDFSSTDGKSLSENKSEQNKLAKSFAKHNVANRTNRIIMTKFAEIIA